MLLLNFKDSLMKPFASYGAGIFLRPMFVAEMNNAAKTKESKRWRVPQKSSAS